MSQATSISDLKRTSTMVAKDAGIGSVKKFFESQKATMAAVLPKHMDAERMLKLALGALRTTPKLMQCRTDSLFGSIVQCAQLGLEPNTPLGHAYLLPFENRQKGITEVQIILGYKGLIDLARRSGQIVSIAAHEVCQKDHFEYEYGLDEKLVHRPALGERGPVIAFYAAAKLVGGGYAFEVMSTGAGRRNSRLKPELQVCKRQKQDRMGASLCRNGSQDCPAPPIQIFAGID
jgi:recombination protein RecT